MIYTIVACIVCIILLSIWLRPHSYIENPDECNLDQHGVTLLRDILSPKDVESLNKMITNNQHDQIKKKLIDDPNISSRIKNVVGDNYIFQDYIWLILKSNVHTCHRDNNGKIFNADQQHDSYTILFFLEKMERCLDVIPGSHKNSLNLNLTDTTKSIVCNPGDAILFNANLIHTGSFNTKKNNRRIQMKITHKDDIKALNYYENFNKYVDKENNVPDSIRYIQKHFTCQFPIVSDMSQNINIMSARGSSDGANIPLSQKIFSFLTYGDSKYYDLPDISLNANST